MIMGEIDHNFMIIKCDISKKVIDFRKYKRIDDNFQDQNKKRYKKVIDFKENKRIDDFFEI